MDTPSVIHSTFVIERSYPGTPERIFSAFADPTTKRRWFYEGGGHQIEQYALDFRVGGEERARFLFGGGPLKGVECVSDTRFQDIVPNRRMVLASRMTIGGKCISASLATFELSSSETGTDLTFTHQGAFFEGADSPEMREGGWRTLFERLAAELAGNAQKKT